MSEGHGEPPADVRSFLPRPGEPVEQYAERLRVLHRDLTLVLQAVERGLATAAHPEDVEPPVPDTEPIEIVPEAAEPPAPPVPAPATQRGRMPRVEVMPASSGEQRRHEQEERREPIVASEPAPGWPAVEEDEETPAHAAPPRRSQPLPARPSAASATTQREPQWIERDGEGFTAPTFPAAPAPARLTVSPFVATAFILAWLVVVALLVALLVS